VQGVLAVPALCCPLFRQRGVLQPHLDEEFAHLFGLRQATEHQFLRDDLRGGLVNSGIGVFSVQGFSIT